MLKNAVLILEDGTALAGHSVGFVPEGGSSVGTLCFNTAMQGYPEIISDPSYAGELIVFTYPQIGIYGVNTSDLQSQTPVLAGVIVSELIDEPSNFASDCSLPAWLKAQQIVAIAGIDTRALTQKIRSGGAQQAIIAVGDNLDNDSLLHELRESPALEGQNLVAQLQFSARSSEDTVVKQELSDAKWVPASAGMTERARSDINPLVIVYDCGVKQAILDNLADVGLDYQTVDWDTPAQEVLDLAPAGVFFSNGPGDPAAVDKTYQAASELLGKVPIFGICLGHQMLNLAAGGTISRLKFGHHGANHPVMNLLTGRVEITSQNHNFSGSFESLGHLMSEQSAQQNAHPSELKYWSDNWQELKCAPVVNNAKYGRIQLTHINLYDGTAEGIAFLDSSAFSVQYHPEAAPGPHDAHYLFTAFRRLIEGKPDYLNIDIALNR